MWGALLCSSAGVVAALVVGCTRDDAEREYGLALQGDRSGGEMSFDEVVAHVDRAIALNPRRAAYWHTRAGLSARKGDYARAISDLDRAIALEGDWFWWHFERGEAVVQSGQPARALADFDWAIARNPRHPVLRYWRSLARASTGDGPGALEDADRLAELDSGEAHYPRGVALQRLGRHREAVAEFDAILQRNPTVVYALRARAESLRRIGEERRALADDREAERRAKIAHPWEIDPLRGF